MRNKLTYCLVLILVCFQWAYSRENSKTGSGIIIVMEAPLPEHYTSDILSLDIISISFNRFIAAKRETIESVLKNGLAKWELKASRPTYLYSELFRSRMAYLAEVGDSVHIRYINGQPVFSGKGAAKFMISKMIASFLDSLSRPTGLSEPERAPASSLQDYLAWNEFLNNKTKSWMYWLDNNREKISEFVYLRLKGTLLTEIEKIRMHKFHSIRRSTKVGTVNQYGLTNEDLCHIYDTTMDNATSRWLRFGRDFIFDPDYAWDMLHDEDYRRKGKFFRTSESDTSLSGKDPADPYVTIYNRIKELYRGIVRENFMVYTFNSGIGVLRKVGFTPKVENMLADYYAQPGYSEAKKMIKDYEIIRKEKWNRYNVAEFELTDTREKTFSSKQLKGKVVVMDFWFTGCTGCVQMAPALQKVEEEFATDSNIVFLSISVDKKRDQWTNSIAQKKYTSGGGIQLYTGGQGNKHDIIKRLLVESYPTLEIIDQKGMLIKFDKKQMDPRNDNGQAMVEFLQKQLSIMKDGPYVFYDNKKVTVYSIDGTRLSKRQLDTIAGTSLQVQSDQRSPFTVFINPVLSQEAAEYAMPEKLFALSDIEGNLDSFRKLLQKNRIIDENNNWIFGSGHLVFAGDMFDRGNQVTECLWLIYSLEKKAKEAGGHVHFILGNHEIMNLQGDHRYTEQKYKDNAALMNKTLTQLYNEDSELGRWLRRKNIMERIGDTLFVHGGISRKLNQLPLSITEINQIARPHYAVKSNAYGNDVVNCIMSTSTSPFWYRTYYEDKEEMIQVIDSTLQKFNVNHIITGHTIVADTISLHYGGKVINLDTRHAEGISEALLVENGIYYRANTQGEKFLLLEPPKSRITQSHQIPISKEEQKSGKK